MIDGCAGVDNSVIPDRNARIHDRSRDDQYTRTD
jgi:hypothetical protein